MAKKAAKKTENNLTAAQRLGSLAKFARVIMRKGKGLNGDQDRLPMLKWMARRAAESPEAFAKVPADF